MKPAARGWKPPDPTDPTGDGYLFVSRWRGRVLVWEVGAPAVVMTPNEARALAAGILSEAERVEEEAP